jgi:phospholipid/cholesterol/gamma-HCH transport system permease protein
MQRLGRWFLDKIEDLLYFTGFSWQVIRQTFSLRGRHKVGYKVLVMQILFTGVNALGIISFISIALGAVIISQGISILPQFGQGSLVYTILITVITPGAGPHPHSLHCHGPLRGRYLYRAGEYGCEP